MQSYHGITFTMPDVLWPLFRDNPAFAKALLALAAQVILAQMSARHGLRVGAMAILHTFNGKLEFNSHVHTMVTAGGLRDSSRSNGRKSACHYDFERNQRSDSSPTGPSRSSSRHVQWTDTTGKSQRTRNKRRRSGGAWADFDLLEQLL
jgi:Putative transposase